MKLAVFLILIIGNSFAINSDDAPYSFIHIEKSKLIETIPRAISNDNFQLTCIGDTIDFLGQPLNLFFDKAWSSEVYWKKITIKGDILLVPDFGAYRQVNKIQGVQYWVAEKKNGWAKLIEDSGYFVATIQMTQLQGRCLNKHKNWNNLQKL
ncbi:hypothetical protein N9345_00930 [Candidatus Thioglobus sp.]|nr:hypothetical protein [Candidatus Thioglobus sp.]MDB3869784.1 hypothetical protein [Candidatus Thioglobus sp.]MDB3892735.1 hypothetical protein [Candidatus Thioglobus sp.]MDC0388683.1 hypothetical protein [Candidatus Thioglobus sp.]MDC0904285.1 hypothetical protein [Candidatus Thioglobus sp.]